MLTLPQSIKDYHKTDYLCQGQNLVSFTEDKKIKMWRKLANKHLNFNKQQKLFNSKFYQRKHQLT